MWVRSQNKSRLIKCDYITIDKRCVNAIHNIENGSLLGIYSSNEKALKVLDMIEEYLKNNFGGIQIGNIQVVGQIANIFQMPQDDEVEV